MRTVDFSIGPNKRELRGFIHNDLSSVFGTYRERPAVIVLPGGGYEHLSLRAEDPVVFPLLAEGYQVFLLKYSLLDDMGKSRPEEELALSVKLLKEKSDELSIDPDCVGIMGFSAGGHVAACLACHWPVYGEDSRPSLVVMGYPVITMGRYTHEGTMRNIAADEELRKYYSLETQVTDDTVPCFLWHTAADRSVSAMNSVLFYSSLLEHGIPSELHIFQRGEHGAALGNRDTGFEEESIKPWFPMAVGWMNKMWGFRH